jgi:CheY-like chemotaxis protein
VGVKRNGFGSSELEEIDEPSVLAPRISSGGSSSRDHRIPAGCNVLRQADWHADGVSCRCVIVDDNESFLAASRTVLQGQGMCVIGVARTVAEGLRSARELMPDLLLVDIDLGEGSGFDLARQLADRVDGVRADVILISAHPEDDFADLIRESPVVGFVSKSDLSKRAIEEVLRGPRSRGWEESSG